MSLHHKLAKLISILDDKLNNKQTHQRKNVKLSLPDVDFLKGNVMVILVSPETNVYKLLLKKPKQSSKSREREKAREDAAKFEAYPK